MPWKPCLDDLLKLYKGKQTKAVSVRYFFFRHTNKRDKAKGRVGNTSDKAEHFYHTALCCRLGAEYESIGEQGTIVKITEILELDQNPAKERS